VTTCGSSRDILSFSAEQLQNSGSMSKPIVSGQPELAPSRGIEIEPTPPEPPILVESIGTTNIVRYNGSYISVPQAAGPIDLASADLSTIPGLTIDATVRDARRRARGLLGTVYATLQDARRRARGILGAAMKLEHVNISGVQIAVRPDTTDLAVARSCLGGEFDLLRSLTLQFNFVIDGGGYIGTAAIALARMFPSATIVSLEPAVGNFEILSENVRPYANIVAINKALDAMVDKKRLYDRGTGECGYTIVPDPRDCRAPTFLQVADTTTIEALMDQFGARGIDIVKLDIEGAEKDVLEASAAWLPKTSVIAVELHDRIQAGCTAAFEAATQGMATARMGGDKVIAYPLAGQRAF
jgi:FkbM family methyltransferase